MIYEARNFWFSVTNVCPQCGTLRQSSSNMSYHIPARRGEFLNGQLFVCLFPCLPRL